MDLLAWNLNFRTAEVLEPIRRLRKRPTVLALQEVSVGQFEAIADGLLELGYTVLDSCDPTATEKRYGNIVAVTAGTPAARVPTQGFPWPQLVLHARLRTDAGPLSIVSVHIPNGSGNGWRKIDALEALGETVLRCAGEPLVIAGDFNEPQFALQDGSVVTWGQELEDGRWVTWDSWSFDGVSGTGERWDSAVRWFFERSEESGLRNAFWLSHGQGEMEASHVTTRGADRWFDHIFVSRHFAVDSCDYLHEWRTDGYSDHSPLRASLSPADQLRDTQYSGVSGVVRRRVGTMSTVDRLTEPQAPRLEIWSRSQRVKPTTVAISPSEKARSSAHCASTGMRRQDPSPDSRSWTASRRPSLPRSRNSLPSR